MIYLNGQKTQEIVLQNNAFLNGDAVKVHFFVKNHQLIMAEECYFFFDGFYAKNENEYSAFFYP